MGNDIDKNKARKYNFIKAIKIVVFRILDNEA